jgi:signal transduction histidine kinase/DNA-binding NarL/FixJ family response regulator
MNDDVPGLSVLLVEDNPGDARLIREMLAEASHTPTRLVHLDHLGAALQRLREPGIDVVLLDLGLPDSQGLATFCAVRAAAPRLPIVVLSGHTDTTLALRAVREGAQDYLLKGHVDPEILVRALRYAVEHKRIAERQRFLAEASRALAGSLDYEATLERVVRLAVPLLADACLLQLATENGSKPRLVVHDVDSAREAELRHASEQLIAGRDEPHGVPIALQPLGFAASMAVPLGAHGSQLGALWFLRSAASTSFTQDDEELLDEFALRSALALENASLHRELQLAVRLRDEVLATTSHDLRNPLSGIKLQGVLLRRLLRADPAVADAEVHERVVHGLDEVDAAITRSLGLIQELLDAACLQAGRQLQLIQRATDLVALATRAVAEHQARTDYHTIQMEGPTNPLVGDWDPLRLARVLDNLLSNALKYSLRGDTIRVALKRETDAAGEWVVLRVQDHGVGIPAAELGRIFDRFYRGSNVAREVRGAGIGLAGVRQIVEQHGGRITVESQEGVGSTFTVRLPLREARPAEPC